jgi:phenylpropionate dioxygenase-like ring-hydroxylating dioxygenase large terminal subunit
MLVHEVPALREYWYVVSYSSAVTNRPVPVRLFGEDYVVWRESADTPARAAVDECPHRAARLSQGWITNGALTCPYHGWQFDGRGACVEIPSNEPGLPIPPRARIDTVLCQEKYGLVWVCVGLPRVEVPVLPEADDPSFTLIHELMDTWHASAPRIIDNALDVSHVAWVHRNSVGSSADPRLTGIEVHRAGEALSFAATYTVRIDETMRKNTGIISEFTKRSTYGELVNPLLFRGVLQYHENGLMHVLYKTATPIDDYTTLFCQFIARNDSPDDETRQIAIAVDNLVQSEDKTLLEAVRPDFPLQPATEIHAPSDRMTIQYRRILAELAAEHSLVRPDEEWARPLTRDRGSARKQPEQRVAGDN